MNVFLPFAIVLAAGGAVYLGMLFVTPFRGKRCLACGAKELDPDMAASVRGTGVDPDGRRFPYVVSAYRCRKCGAEWRNYNNTGLITRAAYEAGARAPIPTAIIHEERPR